MFFKNIYNILIPFGIEVKIFLGKVLPKIKFDMDLRSLKIPKDMIETIFQNGSQLNKLLLSGCELYPDNMKIISKEYKIKRMSFINCEYGGYGFLKNNTIMYKNLVRTISETSLGNSLKLLIACGDSLNGDELKEMCKKHSVKGITLIGSGGCNDEPFEYCLK